MWPFGVDRLYLGLLVVAVALSAAAVVLADDAAVAFLAAAIGVGTLAMLWRAARTQHEIGGSFISGSFGADTDFQVISETGSTDDAMPPVSDEAKNVPGRVESWDEETGWGVLSANLPNGGVFAHFSVVEGEGYRTLTRRTASRLAAGADLVRCRYPSVAPGTRHGGIVFASCSAATEPASFRDSWQLGPG